MVRIFTHERDDAFTLLVGLVEVSQEEAAVLQLAPPAHLDARVAQSLADRERLLQGLGALLPRTPEVAADRIQVERVAERSGIVEPGARGAAAAEDRAQLLVGQAEAPPDCLHLAARFYRQRGGLGLLASLGAGEHATPVMRSLAEVREADPRGRPAVPTRSGEELTGLGPVVRQPRRALVESIAFDVLDHPRDGRVAPCAALAQL